MTVKTSKCANPKSLIPDVPDKQISEPIPLSESCRSRAGEDRLKLSAQSSAVIDRAGRTPKAGQHQSFIPRSSMGGELSVNRNTSSSRDTSPFVCPKGLRVATKPKPLCKSTNPSTTYNGSTGVSKLSGIALGQASLARNSTSARSAKSSPSPSTTRLETNGSTHRLPTWTPPSRHLDTRAPWVRPERPKSTQASSAVTCSSTISSTTPSKTLSPVTSPHVVSVSIPPLANRLHIRTSPYDRLSRLSYGSEGGSQESHVGPVRAHPSYKSVTARSQPIGTDKSTKSTPVRTCTVTTQVTSPKVSCLVSQSVAFYSPPQPSAARSSPTPVPLVPETPVAVFTRPPLRKELSTVSGCSLASDDLMLDTDIGWLDSDGEAEENEDESHLIREENNTQTNRSPVSKTRSTSWSRSHAPPPHVSREPSIVHSRLESVTEASHDDLTRLSSLDKCVDDNTQVSGRTDGSATEVVQGTVVHLRPKPNQFDKGVDASVPDRRRHTTSFGDPATRPLFSGLRRLRSIPGRYRSASISSTTSSNTALGSNDPEDLSANTHLGERTCVLLASEQRQMVQELQGIKVTLLKLKRLLSERRRPRKTLPTDWFSGTRDFGQSEESTIQTPTGRSRTCSDSGVPPAPYSSSLSSSDGPTGTGDRFSDLSPNDSMALASDPTAVAKLLVIFAFHPSDLEYHPDLDLVDSNTKSVLRSKLKYTEYQNLAQLQKENQQLCICSDRHLKSMDETELDLSCQTVSVDGVVFETSS
ncbi:unnamed protein product [Echinostoma caproni]|uniref:AAA domain-containing protein n=1 Tax=Echinostoma caproni TaxID=27848 RepID=A0A183ADW9_9TREM|nr:unnamed protein product [Echinostoma caproni]